MSRAILSLAIALSASVAGSSFAVAGDTGRIKRNPPDAAEADRIASEMAMNDSLLQKGDIVVTDRGFFVFRGVAADGYTFQFSPVAHPALTGRGGR